MIKQQIAFLQSLLDETSEAPNPVDMVVRPGQFLRKGFVVKHCN